MIGRDELSHSRRRIPRAQREAIKSENIRMNPQWCVKRIELEWRPRFCRPTSKHVPDQWGMNLCRRVSKGSPWSNDSDWIAGFTCLSYLRFLLSVDGEPIYAMGASTTLDESFHLLLKERIASVVTWNMINRQACFTESPWLLLAARNWSNGSLP